MKIAVAGSIEYDESRVNWTLMHQGHYNIVASAVNERWCNMDNWTW